MELPVGGKLVVEVLVSLRAVIVGWLSVLVYSGPDVNGVVVGSGVLVALVVDSGIIVVELVGGSTVVLSAVVTMGTIAAMVGG